MDWQRLARANTHPLRIAILEVLAMDGGRRLSPKELSLELQESLSTINYHVLHLAEAGLLELVDTRRVRGATEHFYRPAPAGASLRSARGRAEEGVGEALAVGVGAGR